MKIKDITHKKIGELTAVKFEYIKNHKAYWLFKCNCGKEIVKRSDSITESSSCGCKKTNHKHGMANTTFYNKWKKMRQRCNNKNNHGYKDYGGRGISVCERWDIFENFKDDMYDSYCKQVDSFGKKDSTIERKDVNGNYCLENCKWATIKEQNNNMRSNVVIKHNGKEKNIYEWSEITGINVTTIWNRINMYGWSKAKALTTMPIKK